MDIKHIPPQASKKHVNEAVAKQIQEKVAPVVMWLRTAEEESEEEEDEEDDDDDVEVVYTEKASKTGIITETVPDVSVWPVVKLVKS